MHLLSSLRDAWNALGDEQRRERDERDLMLHLLAIRDAFLALVLVLLPLSMVLQMYLLREAGGGLRGIALLPMAAMILAGLVQAVSWKMRGGGFSRNVSAVQAGSAALGLVVAYGLSCLLAWAGIISRSSSAIALLIAITGGSLLTFYILRRKNPSDE